MIKKILKNILPVSILNLLKGLKVKWMFIRLNFAYFYDLKRYYNFSSTKGDNTSEKLIGKIIREYHVIEKGLTMPETRLGFGKQIITSLCNDCNAYLKLYGNEDEQLKHALGVLLEYEQFHMNHHFNLDEDILSSLLSLKSYSMQEKISAQRKTTKPEYFKYTGCPFPQFSNSRSSIRNYTNEDIPLEKLINVLELVRNTPSACNRQCWRTYLYTNNEQINKILVEQGGNRGFGHMTNKLIIITAELGVFYGLAERNQAYIDGGMYAMNVLYALHYNNLAACILNCSHSPEKDKKIRNISKIKESEVFIAMIACGIPPEEFMIASSERYELKMTNTVIR